MNCYTIPDSMYAAEILLIVNSDKDKMLDAVERAYKVGRQAVNIVDDCAGGGFSVTLKTGKISYAIWLEKYDGKIKSQANLVHECLHFVNWLLNDRGIKFHLDSDDVQCYYLEHIVGNCLITLKKLKVKGKK